MKAIIMAGGKGTRLRPLTNDIPKPMVKIIDKPVMEHIINLLKEHGIKEIAVTLGYRPEVITEYFGDGKAFGVDLSYFIEKEPLGTAGGVKNTGDFVEKGDVLVISGDSYTNMNLSEAIAFHRAKNAELTLVATPHPSPKGLGVLEIDFEGRVTTFIEKPEISRPALINTGIYVINKSVIKSIPDGFFDFGKQLLPNKKEGVYAYVTYEFWSDIGTLPSYYYTNYQIALDSLSV